MRLNELTSRSKERTVLGKTDIKEAMALIKRGAFEIIEEKSLEARLKKSIKEKKPLRIKLGLDPSSPDIHLGHTVVLNKLRDFQNLGHIAVFVIGDYTARIGDPSGRNKLRPPLTPDQIKTNAKTYTDQAFKILDPAKVEVVYNHDWLSQLSISDVITMCAQTSVAQMLERDDFTKRYKAKTPIFLHEFLYPLLQGYDSVVLKNDIELGGTDQKFNLLVGRDLQRNAGMPPQDILMTPILEGLDGVQKMSKSLGNTIALNDPPKDMFGKIMSVSDKLMLRYYELLSFRSDAEIKTIQANVACDKLHPMEAKTSLAHEITERFHGKAEAEKAKEEFYEVHSEGGTPENIDLLEISEKELPLSDLVIRCGFSKSNRDSRRKITEGCVSIDHEKILDPNQIIKIDNDEHLIRFGKRHFKKYKRSNKT